MNAGIYFKTIRPLALMIWLLYPFLIWFLLLRKRVPALEWATFIGGNILLPSIVGFVLVCLTTELLRRPFFPLLPGARRYFLRAQVVAFTLCSGLLVWLSVHLNPSVPILAIAGMVVGSMSLMLIRTPGVYWGPAWLTVLFSLGLIALLAWQAEAIQAWTQGHPWAVALSGLGVAVLCFAIGFSRKRIRSLALTPYSDPLAWWSDRKSWKNERIQKTARSKRPASDWLRAPVGESLWSWMRVIRHAGSIMATPPATLFVSWLLMMVVCCVAFPLMLLFSSHRPIEIAALAEQIRASFFGETAPFACLGLATMPVWALGLLSYPDPLHLYPLSRERRMQLVLVLVGSHWVLVLGSMSMLALGLSWIACSLSGAVFVLVPAPIFATPVIMAPLLALSFLLELRNSARGQSIGSDPLVMFLVPLGVLVVVVISTQAAVIFSLPFVLAIVAATAITGGFSCSTYGKSISMVTLSDAWRDATPSNHQPAL